MSGEKNPSKKDQIEVLLEDINGKMKLLIEGHQALTERMDRLEENFNQKLDERTAQIRGEILGVRKELKQDIEGVRKELKNEIGQVRNNVEEVRKELKQDIGGVRGELKKEIQGVKKELSNKIGKLDEKVTEALKKLNQHEKRITKIEEKI